MNIAVMALQGAFLEHEQMLERLGADTFEIRRTDDWQRRHDALILPGGESTTQMKLLRDLDLLHVVRQSILCGMPVFGTCAGLILLATCVDGVSGAHMATMDISVCRNAYGRQLGSFRSVGHVSGVGKDIPMTFIRAPYIKTAGPGVDVLATVDSRIVAARQDNQLVTAFHPELDDDLRVHEYFLNMVRQHARIKA